MKPSEVKQIDNKIKKFDEKGPIISYCNICNQNFSSKNELKRHNFSNHRT